MKTLLASLLLVPVLALAQSYPSRQIQMLIPYPAGGTTDVMARALQEPMQKALGQTIIVENKSGASGVLAAREVARGKPDGHTLLFINSGIVAVTPHVQKDAGFDGVKDFAPVALVTMAPLFVIVPGNLPVTDLRSYIDHMKKQAAPAAYASAGVGSFGHLASELFIKAAGLNMTHVPYRGQAPTTNAVLTGEVQLLITSMSSAMRGFIDSGKLKLLAVTAGVPSPQAVGVPTVGSVLPGYAAETWFGFVTTAGTPPGDESMARPERSLVTMAIVAAQHRFVEFEAHVRLALRNGCSAAQLEQLVMHLTVYCGVPTGGEAFRIVDRVLREGAASAPAAQ